MYATHLLLEARERGHQAADAMFERAIGYADQYTRERHYTWPEHQAQAYALYLLARQSRNVAERLKAFEAECFAARSPYWGWEASGAALRRTTAPASRCSPANPWRPCRCTGRPSNGPCWSRR